MGQFLNCRGEKTSEFAFYQALCQAVQSSGVNLVDYCCAESIMVDDNSNGNLFCTIIEYNQLFDIP